MLVVKCLNMGTLAACSALLAAMGIAHMVMPVPGSFFISILFLTVAASGFWIVAQMWMEIERELLNIDRNIQVSIW